MNCTSAAPRARACLVVPCLLGLLSPAAAHAMPAPLPLSWCLERAREANPSIQAEAAQRDAADQRIRPAGALEDPRFGYEASNLPVSNPGFDSTPLSGHQLGLRQRVPFPGTLSGRRAAAKAAARAATHQLADSQLTIASRVESWWAELGFSQRSLEVTERNIALLRQLVRIAEAKYRVGTGLQQDVLRAQVELTALLEERLGRQAAVEQAAAELGALLDLSADAAFPRTADLTDPSHAPPLAQIVEQLEQRNAMLLGLAARVDEAEQNVRVAKLEGYPGFDLGLGYRIRQRVPGDVVDGDDFLSAGVTIRLPVNRAVHGARVAEQRALLRRADAAYREARAALQGRLRSAHAELSRATAEAALLETGLVPQARQSLESSRSGYEVGRVDFLGLLDSQVRLFDAELRLIRARADRRRAFSVLESVAGGPLR